MAMRPRARAPPAQSSGLSHDLPGSRLGRPRGHLLTWLLLCWRAAVPGLRPDCGWKLPPARRGRGGDRALPLHAHSRGLRVARGLGSPRVSRGPAPTRRERTWASAVLPWHSELGVPAVQEKRAPGLRGPREGWAQGGRACWWAEQRGQQPRDRTCGWGVHAW